MFEIKEVRIEDQTEHVVTDCPKPVFGIKVWSDQKEDAIQWGEILVRQGDEVIWRQKFKDDFICIPYTGKTLEPESLYEVAVVAQDLYGQEAKATNVFWSGKMGKAWQASWITHPTYAYGKKENPAVMVFQHHFSGRKKVKKASVCITALGVYQLQINGKEVGDVMLAPGYTSYKNQMQYQVYDVTSYLQEENVITVSVAGGWAVATFGPFGSGQHAGKKQALLMEVRMQYADGTWEIFGTDETWKVTVDGPVREASIYDGEVVDARQEAGHFVSAQVLPKAPTKRLLATYGNLPRRIKRLEPVAEHEGKDGYIFDFGQNFAGLVNLKIDAKGGEHIRARHAEILMDGELFTQPLRTAKAKIDYICREGQQEYSPHFTYMGFRYVEVCGIARQNFEITADVVSSMEDTTGDFHCSNADINRLQENIKWGGLSNFVDIPTDCPQRDERLGWTGDIAVFAQTACFNFDMTNFLKKWLMDMRSEQGKRGGIPFVVPDEMHIKLVSAGWGDSCVMVPWALYMDRGDIRVLEDNYEMISKYLQEVEKMAHRMSLGDKKYLWDWGFSFGDWLTYGEGQLAWMKKRPWVSTAYYAHTTQIASQIAHILGKTKDEERYKDLRAQIIRAYRKYFTDGKGRIKKEFQTAYVCPLYFGMVEGDEKEAYARNLLRLVEEADDHLATGFLGTPYLLFALSDAGYADKAYDLLLQDTCPSWLYEVKAGATTIWERWDALREDGSVNLGEGNVKDISEQDSNLGGGMVSFNHYANGAVGDWLYRRCAGIEAMEAGYRKIRIAPVIGGGLDWVDCFKETPYGRVEVYWKREKEKFSMNVRIPFGTEAEIILPDGSKQQVNSGDYHYEAQIG